MSRQMEWARTMRVSTVVSVALVIGVLLPSGIARAGERQFLVILATSPKQYPNPNRDPQGLPPGGLITKQLIFNQYFDKANNDTGSFAEYWEEISYGDVTISGEVTDWISLPWAIQPPLLDPLQDDGIANPGENLDDADNRNSPANFYDLDNSGQYQYGVGEQFNNQLSASIIDPNGDPPTGDDGPTNRSLGSFHSTGLGPFYYPVWKPGERFVDMDEDDRWDGLDEARNQMDWLPVGAPDGAPDLDGPWIDLNGDRQAENAGDCLYLDDGDNDGNPDCCPDGAGQPGCEPYSPDAGNTNACPPTTWTGRNGEIQDCNGNLIPDACDVSCGSVACRRTGWPDDPRFVDTGLPCDGNADCDTELGFGCDPPQGGTCKLCGSSRDELPWTGGGGMCAGQPDGIPDECQFAVLNYPNPDHACVEEDVDEEHPCYEQGTGCIRQIPPRSESMEPRCEFNDSNGNDELDVVEPFENFLRRWDPCIVAPEASPDNQDSFNAHWVKVYDPSSPIPDIEFQRRAAACPLGVSTFNYHDDAYIRHNYPARGKLCTAVWGDVSRTPCDTDADCPAGRECRTGIEELIAEASGRPLYGSHDPDGKLGDAGATCVCPNMPCTGRADCSDLSPMSICAAQERCIRDNDCESGRCIDPDGSSDGVTIKYCEIELACTCSLLSLPGGGFLPNACIAGYHTEYNPPDRWFDQIALNGPGNTEVYTTKMRPAGNGRGNNALLTGVTTPKPGTYMSPGTDPPGLPIDDPWYEPAWQDRYNAMSCPNPDFDPAVAPGPGNLRYRPCECELGSYDPTQPEGPNNQRLGPCNPAPWPGVTCQNTGVPCVTDADCETGDSCDVDAIVDNIRPLVPFDDVDRDTYDPIVHRRFFKANAGGLNGDGTGWIDCGNADNALVVFETGDLNGVGFEEECDAPILPEEVEGTGEPGIFYDGWVEHDDLASSKYHRAGDQRLGEVTSPFISVQTFRPPASDPENPSAEIEVSAIWGEDRGIHVRPSPAGHDGILVAAGPYAKRIHGNHHRDAGNVLTMEMLTWRQEPPFNNGAAWETDLSYNNVNRVHPYAGPTTGLNLGFRDYNLDGLVDQGEVRFPGSENYQSDSYWGTANDGIESRYPFHRNRLMEDCVEALDEVVDFDGWVDPVAMDRLTCSAFGNDTLRERKPYQFVDRNLSGAANSANNFIEANGVLSGIVLLPQGAHRRGDFNSSPSFIPIHNEDGGDPEDMFPAGSPQLNWNLFFHDLVISIGTAGEGEAGIPPGGYQTAFSAHEYLHAWERFPDLYDYDIYEGPGAILNCPVGQWDIMASGGLVHPAPILKEKPCTEWISPIDLTTVLTPGVTKTVTLPRSEFVRDSYYYLENENALGERYYFWSAGNGFDFPRPDRGLPGAGMLVMHTDVGSNPEALPPLNVTGTRYTYQIIQADGQGQLDLCEDAAGNENLGDNGDPWPGSSNATTFGFGTNPAANWYTQNSWTGIEIFDIRPDGQGSVAVDMNWVPTSIPGLRFTNPPGGVSIPGPGGVERYPVNFTATDVFGGTTVNLYYISDERTCSVSGTVCTDDSGCLTEEFCRHETPISNNLIGQRPKVTPGTNEMSINWNISGVPDGRYVIFAKLVPGPGADGFERSVTVPRAGRNSLGNGTLTFGTCAVGGAPCNQSSDCGTGACSIPPDAINIVGNKARSEAWTATCIDANEQSWTVFSTLTQPASDVFDPENPSPYPLAHTGETYTSVNGEVKFIIREGTEPFAAGDKFTFITTGKTAVSGSVTIKDGKVKQDPTARIEADRLSGDPPLLVNFDGRASTDPNGETLSYLWNFGDGTGPETGQRAQHVFQRAGEFTVVLRVTNPTNGRFGEASVDIDVTNNRPNAVATASPTSGPPGTECEAQGYCTLTVQFSASQSSDQEDTAGEMTYVWDYGDGNSANDSLVPGTVFMNRSHYYSRGKDGARCMPAAPCEFTATLTVYDSGGKSDSDAVTIIVGNSAPKPNVTHTSLQGPDPLTVVFNAGNSSDPDPNDELKIEWIWGDNTPNEVYGVGGPSGDGLVPHRYELPSGVASSSFQTKAIFRDFDASGTAHGGVVVWGPVTVIVNAASVDASDPTACFHICSEAPCFETEPAVPRLDEEFAVDAGCSHDNPPGGQIESYAWDFGDDTTATGMTATHTFTEGGTYAITLTVTDAETPPNSTTTLRAVTLIAGGDGPIDLDNEPPVAAFVVSPSRGFAEVTLFTFDASGSTDPDGPTSGLRYRWSFGDGTTAVGKIATHTYDEVNPDGSGSYMVRLTVRDEDNASTDAIQLVGVATNVGNLSPFAYIATGPRSGTAPATLSFDGRNSFDPNDDPLEFSWKFKKDGLPVDTLSGPVITKLFETAGTYTVELTVDDRRGGVATAGPENITISARATGPDLGDQDADGDGVANSDDLCPNTPAGENVDEDGCIVDEPPPQPVRLCGLGMLPSLFGALLGLVTMMANRRRSLP